MHLSPCRIAAIGFALGFATLSTPAMACSPTSPPTMQQFLASGDVVVRARPRVLDVQDAGEGIEVARVSLVITERLKWRRGRAPLRRIVVTQTGFVDGVNCPPWYNSEDERYFALSFDSSSRTYELTGVTRNFACGG